MDKTEKLHVGHRARFKTKFSLQDARLFATYELLELLLYNTVPQKDTKPIAKRLLMEFSSLEGVLCASVEKLESVNGIGAKTARFIQKTGELLRKIAVSEHRGEAPLCDSYDRVGEGLVDFFNAEPRPAVAVMLLDNAKRLIAIERLFACDLGSGIVRSEKIIETALAKGASLIITAHNHPFGPLFATQGDMATISMLEKELRAAGICVLEHYVISGDSYIGVKEILNGIDSVELNTFLFWADGKRNLWDIALHTAVEMNKCTDEEIKEEFMVASAFFADMEKIKAVEWKR